MNEASFHEVAFELLGIWQPGPTDAEALEPLPSTRTDGYKYKGPSGRDEYDPFLKEFHYTKLCNIVCERLPWVNSAEWWNATQERQHAYMIAALERNKKGADVPIATTNGSETDAKENDSGDKNQEPLPCITVYPEKGSLHFNGVRHDVESEQALRWVKVLAEHHGDWISSKELAKYDSELVEPKTHCLRKHLPDVILQLIESKRAKGSRLRL